MAQPQPKPLNRVVLEDVRLTFPHLFIPKAAKPGDTPKFSASFLFPRTHPAMPKLQAAIVEAATRKWGEKAQEILKMLKAGDKLCVHDGDSKAMYTGYAGNLFINANNTIQPAVVDERKQPLSINDDKMYSGAYVNVSLDIWAQDNQHGKRVNAGLVGLQFKRHGERLAGGATASADDFAQFEPENSDPAGAGTPAGADLF